MAQKNIKKPIRTKKISLFAPRLAFGSKSVNWHLLETKQRVKPQMGMGVEQKRAQK